MRLVKTIFIILSSLSVTACSSMLYQEPNTGPLARVRFATDSIQIAVLRTYGDETCSTNETEWLRLKDGYLVNSSPKRMGMPLWSYHDNAAKEIFIEANRKIYGLFKGDVVIGSTIYSCGVPFAYSFHEGTDYEVFFKLRANTCQVTVEKLVGGPTAFEKQRLAEFSNRINDENKGCLDPFKKQRHY